MTEPKTYRVQRWERSGGGNWIDAPYDPEQDVTTAMTIALWHKERLGPHYYAIRIIDSDGNEVSRISRR